MHVDARALSSADRSKPEEDTIVGCHFRKRPSRIAVARVAQTRASPDITHAVRVRVQLINRPLITMHDLDLPTYCCAHGRLIVHAPVAVRERELAYRESIIVILP